MTVNQQVIDSGGDTKVGNYTLYRKLPVVRTFWPLANISLIGHLFAMNIT